MAPASLRSLPAAARRSLLVYNFLFPVVFLFLLPGLLSRTLRRGNYRANFGQRLGRFRPSIADSLRSSRWHWIHSISVGETLLALKLARELHTRAPELRIVISVTTSTGFTLAEEAAEGAPEWLAAIYNPVDLRSIVRRTFDLLRPERVILIEGEAWPNLLAEAHARAIPVMLASARMSPRSAGRFERFRTWTGPIFNLLEWIAVPEAPDLERWQRIGLPASKLRQTGNIKFDQTSAGLTRTAEFRALLAPLGVKEETPILIAGSTFPGEERLLAEMLPALRGAVPGLFLLIAPRHVERTPAIVRELAGIGIDPVLRSKLRPAASSPSALGTGPSTPLILLDSTGELREWYALATVVFIGKSITAEGGQNPAEAAAIAKPVVTGPHMENFKGVMDLLRENDGVVQVADADELRSALVSLLQSPERRSQLGKHAQKALQVHAGATARTVDLILDSAGSAPLSS